MSIKKIALVAALLLSPSMVLSGQYDQGDDQSYDQGGYNQNDPTQNAYQNQQGQQKKPSIFNKLKSAFNKKKPQNMNQGQYDQGYDDQNQQQAAKKPGFLNRLKSKISPSACKKALSQAKGGTKCGDPKTYNLVISACGDTNSLAKRCVRIWGDTEKARNSDPQQRGNDPKWASNDPYADPQQLGKVPPRGQLRPESAQYGPADYEQSQPENVSEQQSDQQNSLEQELASSPSPSSVEAAPPPSPRRRLAPTLSHRNKAETPPAVSMEPGFKRYNPAADPDVRNRLGQRRKVIQSDYENQE